MLRKNSKIELIRRVPLFSRCSKKDLEDVASIADEIDLPAGKVLMREGDPGREFFVIVEGSADVRTGKRKINTMGAGDFFGEIALVSEAPRTATVTATSDSRMLVVTAQGFRSLVRRHPGLKTKVLEALAERLAPTTV